MPLAGGCQRFKGAMHHTPLPILFSLLGPDRWEFDLFCFFVSKEKEKKKVLGFCSWFFVFKAGVLWKKTPKEHVGATMEPYPLILQKGPSSATRSLAEEPCALCMAPVRAMALLSEKGNASPENNPRKTEDGCPQSFVMHAKGKSPALL